MPFLTQGKTNWKYILIVVILAVITGGGILWLSKNIFVEKPLIKLPKINEKYCEKDSDCVLSYTGSEICPSCILDDYQCVSLEYYNKVLWPEWERKHKGIVCEGCPTIADKLQCVCEEKLCKKILKDETANWKTYRNEGYGYEIKYPEDWFLREFCEGIVGQPNYCETRKAGFSTKETYEKVSQLSPLIGGIPNDDDINIWVEAKTKYPGKSLRDYVIYFITEIEGYKIEEVKIETKKSTQGLDYFLYTNPTIPTYQTAFFEHGDKFYRIESHADIPNVDRKIKVFNQMLSTFKFIEIKATLTPEEVVTEFFNWYISEGSAFKIKDRLDVTQDYKQKINKEIETQTMVDPVIFAQDTPDQGFKVGQAIIQDKNAFVKVTLIYSGDDFGHVLKVDLILEDNQWKINNITYLKGEVTWKTYQNEKYGYKINYPDFWSFIKDKPENIVLSNCPKESETCSKFNIDILSDIGGGNLNNIEEVKLLKNSGWNWEYVTVSGVKAIKLVKPCPTVMGACTGPELTRYYIIKGNYTYRIEFKTGYAGCGICDQMLSTFRLLK